MCGPITPGAAAGIAGGAAGFGFLQQRGQARATNRFNKRQYEINKSEALRSMVQEITGNQIRISQERQSASQVLQQLTREASEALGTAVASNTTVEGASVDALLRDYRNQELIRIGVVETDLRNTEEQIGRNIMAIRSSAQTRINQGFPAPAPVPNLLEGAIQIGTSAFGSYLAAGGAKQ